MAFHYTAASAYPRAEREHSMICRHLSDLICRSCKQSTLHTTILAQSSLALPISHACGLLAFLDMLATFDSMIALGTSVAEPRHPQIVRRHRPC